MATDTWNAAYEADPADTDLANLYANRARNLKLNIRERMEIDHEWEDSTDGGKHKKLTFLEQAAAPTPDTDEIGIYALDDGGNTELFMKNEAGTETQLTRAGSLASESITPTEINDYSDDDAEQALIQDPGNSDAQINAITLAEELETLRYALKRHGVGIPTKLTDGSADASWFDGLPVGPDLMRNGSFLKEDDFSGTLGGDPIAPGATPFGWITAFLTDSELSWQDLPSTEGRGKYLRMLDAAGSFADLVSQTLIALRANTLYLITARVLNTTAEVKLTTTGALVGTFGNLDLITGAAGDGYKQSASDWQTLQGIIETDGTPTDLRIILGPNATNYSWGIAKVSCREIIGSKDVEGTGREDRTVRGGNLILHSQSSATFPGIIETETTIRIFVPGDNYSIAVFGTWRVSGDVDLSIEENDDLDGVGTWQAVSVSRGANDDTYPAIWANLNPTPGNTYGYRLSANQSVNGNNDIIVMLTRQGSA